MHDGIPMPWNAAPVRSTPLSRAWASIAARSLADYVTGGALRLGVTRLSRAGKTVFLTALIQNNGVLFFCDTHFNIDPTASQVAEMTILAAEAVRRFGITPRDGRPPKGFVLPAPAPAAPAPSQRPGSGRSRRAPAG